MDKPDNICDVCKPTYITKRITVATIIKGIRSSNLNVCSANKRIFCKYCLQPRPTHEIYFTV